MKPRVKKGGAMIELSLSDLDLVLQVSAERNLESTVNNFREVDVPVWQKLLSTDPVQFMNLAAYGYQARQRRK
ncbi:MAG TPA: hypothetical protein VJ508_20800, partial [Saprospiraceae bacterium]|nr:hypothetical protein [Saprospiraceae bacterium]